MDENKEKITVEEAVGFWANNKKWLIPVIVAVVSLLGGNADRVGTVLNGLLVSDTEIKAIDDRVTALEKNVESLTDNVTDLAKLLKDK